MTGNNTPRFQLIHGAGARSQWTHARRGEMRSDGARGEVIAFRAPSAPKVDTRPNRAA